MVEWTFPWLPLRGMPWLMKQFRPRLIPLHVDLHVAAHQYSILEAVQEWTHVDTTSLVRLLRALLVLVWLFRRLAVHHWAQEFLHVGHEFLLSPPGSSSWLLLAPPGSSWLLLAPSALPPLRGPAQPLTMVAPANAFSGEAGRYPLAPQFSNHS